MIRSILVALDETPRAPDVLKRAHEIAECFDARMILLRIIVVPPEFPPASATHYHDELPTVLAHRARDSLIALAANLPRALAQTPLVLEGEPWRVIVDTAERSRVDLVVIGSHGYHVIDRVLGTTAAKVVNHATRDVVVVHYRAHA